MKAMLIFLLITCHVLINGVAASIHITEDYEHGHEVAHQHFFSADQSVQNDDWQHEHDDCTHGHLQFQLFDSEQLLVQTKSAQSMPEKDWWIIGTEIAPPVPPPTL